jgi:hypothetical protein
MAEASKFDKKHIANLNRLARDIDALYSEVIKEVARLGAQSGFTGDKPFSFDDFPGLKLRVDKMFEKLHKGIYEAITKGDAEAWQLSCDKNDSWVDAITLSSKLSKEQISQFKPRNIEALKAFQSRKISGMGLSARVWKIVDSGISDFELALDIALGDGRSAAMLSRDIRNYLKEPNKLFRRVRDKHGNLVLSQRAKNYHPGQGVYRSSYKNAMRLSRSEVNIAYHTADYENWKSNDLVLGFEIILSNNHPIPDICDELAGKYPKTFKFTGWHPQCRCVAIPITPKFEDFIKYEEAILAGEDVSNYQFSGRVKKVPQKFTNWCKENQGRIQKMTAKGTLPYFLRDNAGIINKPLSVPVPQPPIPAPKLSETQKLIQNIKNPASATDYEMKKIISKYSEENPDNFYGGLKKVSVTSKSTAFMYNSRRYKRVDGSYDISSGNEITIINRNYKTANGKFNPAEELKTALAIVKEGKELTFNQEYALESLWHEIRHAGAKGWGNIVKANDMKRSAMEVINQFCARKSYPDFIKQLGGKAMHQNEIMASGYGYSQSVGNFRKALSKYGIAEDDAFKHFKDLIQKEPYENIWLKVADFLKGKGVKNATELVENLTLRDFESFL